MTAKERRITFLSSGNGGNLKFLYLLSNYSNSFNFQLSVIADRKCGTTLFAQKNGIEYRIVDVIENEQLELSDSISQLNPDVIFTTIHKIISPQVLNLHGEQMLNLHYSYLPNYAGIIGMKGVDIAIRNQDEVLGVTTHKVISELDAGPITIQSYFQNPKVYEIAVKASFRVGCLQIWESIQEHEENNFEFSDKTESLIENLVVHHSRPISNLPNFVNESFWLTLSNL